MPRVEPGFLLRNVGFQITFSNKYTISVVFGPGSYTEHHADILKEDIVEKMLSGKFEKIESKDGEICVFDPQGSMIDLSSIGLESNTVKGHVSSDEVADIIQKIRDLPIKRVEV